MHRIISPASIHLKKKKTGPCYEGLAWNFLFCVDQASFDLVLLQPFHLKCKQTRHALQCQAKRKDSDGDEGLLSQRRWHETKDF